jgi:hypothetical protein
VSREDTSRAEDSSEPLYHHAETLFRVAHSHGIQPLKGGGMEDVSVERREAGSCVNSASTNSGKSTT